MTFSDRPTDPATHAGPDELVVAAKAEIREVSVAEAAPDTSAVIDIREADEWDQGVIPGARHAPRGMLEFVIADLIPHLDTAVILYCAGGGRSALAAQSLQRMGYTNVSSLEGGFTAWKNAGRAWALPGGFSTDQRTRYARHIRLPGVGEEGQQKLLSARVLLVGAGGLGSPVALYLAAAGVGTLGIVDDDRVDRSNLQRQVIHDIGKVGEKKIESARQAITALNSDVKVETHDVRLTADNAAELIAGYDVVVDGSDNFDTRYALNDASVELGIPVVHGSIFRFEGQVTVFDPRSGPCYRCLFPEAPPPELAPNCAEAGVLGVLPGVIGTLQATETLKLLLGIGEPLIGRLLTYDALEQDVTTLSLSKSGSCCS